MKRLSPTLPFVLGVVLLVAPVAADASSAGRIVGKIKNRQGDGLFGAVVTILREEGTGGTLSFARTDSSGGYSISNVLPGVYYLQVSREGFQPLTKADIRVDAGRTTSLDLVLQEFLDLVSAPPDPRNWGIGTVMRSTIDRRLVFRNLPGNLPGREIERSAFGRAAVVSVASSAGLSGENFGIHPSGGPIGTVSNFAFSEPISDKARVVFSGQMSAGMDSYWRVRNTYQYRPDIAREMKFSVGYGRLNVNGPSFGAASQPADFFAMDPSLRDSGGVQVFGFGLEARNRFLDMMTVEYGLDLSRVYDGTTKTVVSPYFQLIFTPGETWVFRGAMMSRRLSDANGVQLPDGEIINLMEPTFVAKIDGDVRVSQFKHAEVAVGRTIANDTSLELALYEDRMVGPGTPFMVTQERGASRSKSVAQLRESQTGQRGLRVEANRRFLDFLSGSVAYVYGTGASLAAGRSDLSSADLVNDLLNYVEHSYYHTFTGRVQARLPISRTNLTGVLRWYPGATLTPVDLFGDRADILTKGVSVLIRQPIPVPEFMATSGRWEALLDVRNLMNDGFTVIPTSDGRVLVARNPRSLRFGLNLNFY